MRIKWDPRLNGRAGEDAGSPGTADVNSSSLPFPKREWLKGEPAGWLVPGALEHPDSSAFTGKGLVHSTGSTDHHRN